MFRRTYDHAAPVSHLFFLERSLAPRNKRPPEEARTRFEAKNARNANGSRGKRANLVPPLIRFRVSFPDIRGLPRIRFHLYHGHNVCYEIELRSYYGVKEEKQLLASRSLVRFFSPILSRDDDGCLETRTNGKKGKKGRKNGCLSTIEGGSHPWRLWPIESRTEGSICGWDLKWN